MQSGWLEEKLLQRGCVRKEELAESKLVAWPQPWQCQAPLDSVGLVGEVPPLCELTSGCWEAWSQMGV
jgi:hypothetical protein